MEPRSDKVFVYGTLRRGFALHSELKKVGARYLGKGQILGRLFDLGEYPGAVRLTRTKGNIDGELYDLQNPVEQLAVLDEIEEYDPRSPKKSLFVRKKATVKLKDGGRVRAWVYFLPKKPRRGLMILSGNYADARHGSSLAR